MKIKATPKFNRSGDVHESLSLQRWIHFSDTDTYDVPKSQILTITNASIGLSKFYDFCVKRMKIEDKSLSYPTDEELDMIESEDEDIINEQDILESMGLVDISSDTMH